MESFKPLSARSPRAPDLSRAEAAAAFDAMLSGDVTPAQIGGFLMGCACAARASRKSPAPSPRCGPECCASNAPADAIDSSAPAATAPAPTMFRRSLRSSSRPAAFPVAKHGNRAASSKSGAADALGALGVKIGVEPKAIERCIEEAGIGFMMAPTHHAAMRHVGPVRVELGTRTIFNLLGPLSNPAGVSHQLIGVFSGAWLEPMAEVLRNLGSERVWIAHGGDGLDEMTTTGPTEHRRIERRRDPRFRNYARRRSA